MSENATPIQDDGLEELMSFISPPEAGVGEAPPASAPDGGEAPAADPVPELLASEDTPPAPAAAPTGEPAAPPPSPAPPPTPPAPDHSAQLLERLAKAEAQRAEAEEAARKAKETQEREEEVARKAQLFDPSTLALTEDEQRVYAQSAPVINKLVRAELQRYHAQTMVPELNRVHELQQGIGTADSTARAALDRAVNATLRAAVPNLDTIAQSPEWLEYLNAPMPELGAGVTRGSLLRTHLDNVNTEAAIHLIRGFTAKAAAPAAAPAASAPTPGRAGGGAPASVAAAARGKAGGEQRFAYSKYSRIADKAARGEVDMEKFDQLTEFYMRKMEEGLVDMDA